MIVRKPGRPKVGKKNSSVLSDAAFVGLPENGTSRDQRIQENDIDYVYGILVGDNTNKGGVHGRRSTVNSQT
jgi:hypothetical protein